MILDMFHIICHESVICGVTHMSIHVNIYMYLCVYCAHAICTYVYVFFDGRNYGVFHQEAPHVVHKTFHVRYPWASADPQPGPPAS
jgi:hypothetical protein